MDKLNNLLKLTKEQQDAMNEFHHVVAKMRGVGLSIYYDVNDRNIKFFNENDLVVIPDYEGYIDEDGYANIARCEVPVSFAIEEIDTVDGILMAKLK